MSFSNWLKIAKNADLYRLSNISEHYYLMVASKAKDYTGISFISRDLPFFATSTNNFFITDVDSNKGNNYSAYYQLIYCHFLKNIFIINIRYPM